MLKKLNFKAIFCVFVLVFSFALSCVEIRAEWNEAANESKFRLAAWNIEFLGSKKRLDSNLREIAEIINRYHFIAITELKHKRDLDEIMTILSKEKKRDYGCMVSPIVGWRDSDRKNKEYYAFLYDKALISVVDMGRLYPDSTNRNRGAFQRNPYWMTFRAGNFDFTVIVVHVTWGRRGVVPRDEEVKALKDVYNAVQRKNGDENDVILVGDFNRWPNLPAFNGLKQIGTMRALFYKKNGCKSTTGQQKPLYDNILFETGYLKEYAKNCGIYLFDLEKPDDLNCCEGKVERANIPHGNKEFNRISNHYPVWAEFRTDLEDDD